MGSCESCQRTDKSSEYHGPVDDTVFTEIIDILLSKLNRQKFISTKSL